jgi:hypothetical protein
MALVLVLGASSGACSSRGNDDEDVGKTSQALEAGTPTRQATSTGDSYVREGSPNQNQGTLPTLRLQASGSNRALVRFDTAAMSELTTGPVTLSLQISSNGNNWGASGRSIAVHRLTHDWTELGATWNCSLDTNTANSSADCSGASAWEMNKPLQPELHPWVETPTATATITNGQSGTVTFDVTRSASRSASA